MNKTIKYGFGILVTGLLIFGLTTTVFAQGLGMGRLMQGQDADRPVMTRMLISPNSAYMYLHQGDTIYQYSLPDMVAKGSIEIQVTEEDTSTDTEEEAVLPPPPFRTRVMISPDSAYLYVRSGDTINQYSIPDLILINSIEIPLPE